MTEFHLVVYTTYTENYGAHDWNGEGQCPQYWKCKGGDATTVAVLTTAEVVRLGAKGIRALAVEKADVWSDDYSQQSFSDYELVCIDDDLIEKVRAEHVRASEDWDREDDILMSVHWRLDVPVEMIKHILALPQPEAEVDCEWDYLEMAA